MPSGEDSQHSDEQGEQLDGDDGGMESGEMDLDDELVEDGDDMEEGEEELEESGDFKEQSDDDQEDVNGEEFEEPQDEGDIETNIDNKRDAAI